MVENEEELGALYAILKGYDSFTEVPEGSPVKKGDILTATDLVENDPVFGGSEIIILRYRVRFNSILGTSFQRGHPAYLFQGAWDVEQLRDEIAAGAWNKKGSLEGNIMDYFKRVNVVK